MLIVIVTVKVASVIKSKIKLSLIVYSLLLL